MKCTSLIVPTLTRQIYLINAWLHWRVLFFHCFPRALYLKPTLKIFYSIFEKTNFFLEIGHKHQDKLDEESSNQIDILLPIVHNCNNQKKIPTSLNFSWNESKVCNLILVKILHTVKCLFEVIQLNTSNITFHFDFSIVQAILKNLTSNPICLSHLLILKTVHTRIPEGNNAPV